MGQTSWDVPPDRWYLARAEAVPEHRPYFQGDVFSAVKFFEPPAEPPQDETNVTFTTGLGMLLPHPCGCHRGDELREPLVMARVEALPAGKRLSKQEWEKNWNVFPLPSLIDDTDYVAMLSPPFPIPSRWISPSSRVACLSLDGVASLHRRVLRYLTRLDWDLANLKNALQEPWDDAAVWQAFRKSRGTAVGYELWKKTPLEITEIGTVLPGEVLSSRSAHLIGYLDPSSNEIE